LVDDFNRADEEPLSDGGAWTNASPGGPIVDLVNQMAVVSNRAQRGTASGFTAAFRNNLVLQGPAVAAMFVDPGLSKNYWLGVVNANNQGYFLDLDSGFADISWFDGGDWHNLGADGPWSNDYMSPAEWALTFVGGSVSVWRRDGSSWPLLLTREAASHLFSGPWFGFIATNFSAVMPFNDFRASEAVILETDTFVHRFGGRGAA
jgi:hypothetical protein